LANQVANMCEPIARLPKVAIESVLALETPPQPRFNH
jgi:hypothetical protein